MLEFLSGFDVLGVGAIVGTLLMLAGFIWVLVDDLPLEELNQRHRGADRRSGGDPVADAATPTLPDAATSARPEDHPKGPRRAA